MLKPCKQNKAVVVKRKIGSSPYYSLHIYRGKRYINDLNLFAIPRSLARQEPEC